MSDVESRGIFAALRRIPGKVWLRMLLLVAIIASGFILLRFTPLGDYFTKDQMIALLEQLRASPWSPAVLIGLYVVTAPILPMTPLVAGGGVVFGPFWGSLINTVGLTLGAMSAYCVGKALGRDFIVHLAGPPRLRRAERAFERRGFWPLVQVRFLPIPFSLVSYGAAMAGVKAPQFLITSTLGLIPATVMHTYFAWKLITDPSFLALGLYLACWGAFVAATGWPTLRESFRRRQRYRELMERRSSRLVKR